MRFSSARRLRSATEFGRVRAEGSTFPGRYVVFSVLRSEEEKPWRVGVITSRKVGGAVQRNLVRRRLREILKAMPLPSGLWLVIIARYTAAKATFAEMELDCQKVARRAGLLPSTHRKGNSGATPPTGSSPPAAVPGNTQPGDPNPAG